MVDKHFDYKNSVLKRNRIWKCTPKEIFNPFVDIHRDSQSRFSEKSLAFALLDFAFSNQVFVVEPPVDYSQHIFTADTITAVPRVFTSALAQGVDLGVLLP
eukprot:TRINITY_DN394_c0_g1_i10.p5 TRINITY_DN394_c0_g1~~TRINITY_DN394_c0_g1_i10.p5  ORF type:complete len:101 (-),score=4.53 TRINITY_DN394_c0_g1_i10:381-683(-)